MSLIGTIKTALGVADSSVRIRVYECRECGNQFESAKDPERATCMECLSNEVDPIGNDD